MFIKRGLGVRKLMVEKLEVDGMEKLRMKLLAGTW